MEFQLLCRTLYKVTFKNTCSGNNFVLDDRLTKIGLRPFVPMTALEILYAVIRGVPTFFKEEDFLKEAKSNIPIRSVRRFTRKDSLSNDFIPTITLKVDFTGDEIPMQIIFEYVKLSVDFYIPPLRQCNKCGRIKHTTRSCKSKSRCLKCGKSDCKNACDSTFCILCNKNGHMAKDKFKYTFWEKGMEISRIKTVKDVA